MLLDRRCPGCHRPSRSLCASCAEALRPPRRHPPAIDGLDSLTVGFGYDERAARLLLAAKNGGRTDILRALAHRVADRLVVPADGPPPGARYRDERPVVTWVPASSARARRRGFDQGRVVAAVIARRHGLRSMRLLRRAPGESQAHRSRAERLVGPAVTTARPSPPLVILVDDVVTTGASLRAAAAALRRSGARTVDGVVLADAERGRRFLVEHERGVASR